MGEPAADPALRDRKIRSGSSDGRRVVVIGGGLAGITAALDCSAAGAQVTLLEVRRRLGGAAYSFERDDLQLDNGQHVFLRSCAAYRGLLARLASTDQVWIQPRLAIPVLKPGAERALLRRGGLPAPLHLAGALARYPHLSLRERASAARAALALARLDLEDERLDSQTLGDWLAAHGQGPRAVSVLWDLIALPTLNLPAAEASLALGAFVFANGLLSGADAGDIGFHRGSLSRTIGEPAARALALAGVDVRLGWRAEGLQQTGAGLEVRGRGGRASLGRRAEDRPQQADEDEPGDEDGGPGGGEADGLSAEAVIVAVPHARAATLLEPLLGAAARSFDALSSSPIVNLHVVYDRRVSEESFAAGVDTSVQYVFDRTAAAGVPADRQYLAVSLSGAEREMGMSVDALREYYLPALQELFPPARQAGVERFMVTREHAATFRAAPGVAALRPGARTSVPGLVLAGAWTATGWPATLEGAVLSGHTAAAEAMLALGVEPRAARSGASAQASLAGSP
jgi:hydroxysqualene dehydroxylase